VLGARRSIVVILVAVLTIGDAALVHAALSRSHRLDPSAAAVSASVSAVTPSIPAVSPSSGAQQRAAKQPGGRVIAAAGERNRLFTASGSTTAWRAHGGCSGKPGLSMTTNSAATWSPLTAPAPHLLRIALTGATAGWAIGVTAACGSPTYYATTDAGKSWVASTNLGPVWLATKAGIRTPTGHVAAPCGQRAAPIDLAPGNTSALVICPSGVRRSIDSGTTWTPVGTVPAGEAVAAWLGGSGNAVLVLTGAPHCGGLRVLTSSDTAKTWAKSACLSDAVAPASVALGSGGGGLLVSAGRAYATTDGGRHWS
jgi:hypothetical protein